MKICYNCFNEVPDGARTCPRCGGSVDLQNEDKYPHALPCGSVLNGKYIVGCVLGQGGFGITYTGQEFVTKKLVAIKEYFPDTMASRNVSHAVVPFNTDRSEGFEYGKKQFLDEAKTLSAFIGSPNIVRVYGYFEENGTAYFVMEYVRGKSLRQYVRGSGGRISWEETWNLLMPVLDALSEVHYRNIIHRDIKPDNIIIMENGSAKLIDFGAARYKHGEKSRSLTAILTPGYAPPEQYYTSGNQGPWTDVYALAATMYFCITGKTPPESIERSFNDRIEKPSSLGISIPDYAETSLLRALSVRENDRFGSTYDFRNAVLEGKSREEEKGAVKYPTPDRNDTTFRDTQKKAASGDADAQYLLGYFYEKGMGTARNDKEAEKWYRLAAEQGNTDARIKLAHLSAQNGPETPQFRESAAGSKGSQPRKSDMANERPQPRKSDMGGEGPQPRKSDMSNESPQHRDGKSGDKGEKDTGNDMPKGGSPSRGKDTAEAGSEAGIKDEVTPKPVSQEKEKGHFTKIMLAVGLIALIAVAGFVISNRSRTSEIDTGGYDQIAERSDKIGGQAENSPQEDTSMMFILSQRDEYQSELESGAKEKAAELGVNLVSQDANYDSFKMQSLVVDARDEGCQAVIVNLVDTELAQNIIDSAGDMKVVFVNFSPADTSVLNENAVYVGPNHYDAGRYQGEALAEYFKSMNKTEVRYILLEGIRGTAATTLRTESVLKALSDNGINAKEACAPLVAMYDYTKAWEEVDAILDDKSVTFDCIIANHDSMALGAIDAMESNGLDPTTIPIVGIDATEEGCYAIMDGKMLMSVSSNPAKMGAASVQTALNMNNNVSTIEGTDCEVDTDNENILWAPYEPVTADNVADYY